MSVEEFINNTLVDFYCKMCECEGITNDEIDQLFVDEDGEEIEDKDFISRNIEVIDDEVILDETYYFIKDYCEESKISIDRLVCFLASKYYLWKFDLGEDNIIRFLDSANLEDIIRLFQENDDFGREMVKGYLLMEANETKAQEIRERIYSANKHQGLIKFEKSLVQTSIITLNELLRNIICNLYNNYIENGCDDITALDNVWEYFIHNFDPLGELDKMGCDQASKDFYKSYMIRLIYADLYEDAANNSIIQSDNEADRLASVVPLVAVQSGKIGIPSERDVRNRILKYFILLQEEKEKRRENRQKTYADNRINVLKKVNPTYLLDELTF